MPLYDSHRVTYDMAVLVAAARTAGFPEGDVPTAAAIAMAESGGKPYATHRNVNGTTDYGVWQINSVHADLLRGGDWKDLNSNAKMAFSIYSAAGNSFSPWSTYKSKTYLPFLPAAKAVRVPGDGKVGAGDVAGAIIDHPKEAAGAAVGGAVDGAKAVVGGVVDAATSIPKFLASVGPGLVKILGLLTSKEFWVRAGMVWLGFVLLFWGLIFLLLSNDKLRGAAKTTAKAATTKGAL